MMSIDLTFFFFPLYCLVMISDSHIVDFPFLFLFLFVLFISFFTKIIISVVICFKESISRSLDPDQSQRTICPSFFFSFLLLPFSFFSFCFFFFFLFFCPTGEKKRSFFFFLSCSCSGPKPRWSGEQWQTCSGQPGPAAFFCLYLSKGFCFYSSVLFFSYLS